MVGTVRKYADRLLELRARAMLPAYWETRSIGVNKRVTHARPSAGPGQAYLFTDGWEPL